MRKIDKTGTPRVNRTSERMRGTIRKSQRTSESTCNIKAQTQNSNNPSLEKPLQRTFHKEAHERAQHPQSNSHNNRDQRKYINIPPSPHRQSSQTANNIKQRARKRSEQGRLPPEIAALHRNGKRTNKGLTSVCSPGVDLHPLSKVTNSISTNRVFRLRLQRRDQQSRGEKDVIRAKGTKWTHREDIISHTLMSTFNTNINT